MAVGASEGPISGSGSQHWAPRATVERAFLNYKKAPPKRGLSMQGGSRTNSDSKGSAEKPSHQRRQQRAQQQAKHEKDHQTHDVHVKRERELSLAPPSNDDS